MSQIPYTRELINNSLQKELRMKNHHFLMRSMNYQTLHKRFSQKSTETGQLRSLRESLHTEPYNSNHDSNAKGEGMHYKFRMMTKNQENEIIKFLFRIFREESEKGLEVPYICKKLMYLGIKLRHTQLELPIKIILNKNYLECVYIKKEELKDIIRSLNDPILYQVKDSKEKIISYKGFSVLIDQWWDQLLSKSHVHVSRITQKLVDIGMFEKRSDSIKYINTFLRNKQEITIEDFRLIFCMSIFKGALSELSTRVNYLFSNKKSRRVRIKRSADYSHFNRKSKILSI